MFSRLTLIAAVVAVGAIGVQWTIIGNLKDAKAVSEARLSAAQATIDLLRKERASDAAINAIPDSELGTSIPDRWMRNPGPR